MPDEKTSGIAALPNEIIMSILSLFKTIELLAIAPTSQGFYKLILSIVHSRLLDAATLQGQKIILEIHHPATRWQTPYLYCDYLGTAPLSSSTNNTESSTPPGDLNLGRLHNLYSCYRPIKPESDRRVIRPHPAGGWLSLPPNSNALVNSDETELVCQNVHLESHELFSQLCTITNLVKLGPKPGLYASHIQIGGQKDTLRIWRHWLADMAKNEGLEGHDASKRLLWADRNHGVGIRMRVQQQEDELAPLLLPMMNVENENVSYTLQYEEVVFRTSRLLLKAEQALDQEGNSSGKAIVFGSWN